jgi:hypothetical protein
MLEILGFVLELLPDFLVEYLLGQLFPSASGTVELDCI